MNARTVSTVSWMAIAAALMSACGGDEGKEGAAELEGAVALSTHYVRVTFSDDVGPDELNAARYSIVDPTGRALAVLEARPEVRPGVPDVARSVLLVTDAQQPVWYTLELDRGVQPSAEPSGETRREARRYAPPTGSTGFVGSTIGETYLKGAVAVGNTSVVLLFSDKLGSNAGDPSLYRIEYPNLAIAAVEVSQDEKAVLLTTSPQESIEYTAFVWGVEGKNGALLDPMKSSAAFQGRDAWDNTAPRLLAAAAIDGSTALLTFDKALSDDAADPTHFTITPDLTIIGATLSQFNTQVRLETMPMVADVMYTVTVGEGVKDEARNAIDPAANSATFSTPILSDGASLPRVVGAVSSGNTGVVVRFSKAMDDAAIAASNYSIVQENVNSEAGALRVTKAEFMDARRVAVELTTLSQNELTYRVSVSNVADLAGNPLAPKVTSNGVLVDPTSATFAGTPPGPGDLVDSDGDGLNDNIEQLGWLVTVTLADGSTTSRQVTSEPGNPELDVDDPWNVAARDTDSDGLDDKLERLLGSDPRQADTDGDSLTDYEEYNVTFTDQNAVDTDGDGLDDFLEVEFFKTDALREDSDGDGYSDAEELLEQGRDPRIADLPLHEIEVGEVRLQIDERFTYTDEDGRTVSEGSSTSTSLAKSQSTRRLSANSQAVSLWAEIGAEGGVGNGEGQAGFFKVFGNAHAGVDLMFQTESESATEAQEAFERSLEKSREFSSTSSATREVVGASISVDVTLRNRGDVAISLSNLEITVQTPHPQDPRRLVPVATLVPQSEILTGEPAVFNIGPGESRGPVLFSNQEVFPNLVEDLMRSPRGLVFRVANYDVVTGDDRNFAFGLQDVREATAGVFIDPGNGNVEQLQAITAGVLNRPRDEYRCAPTGDRPNAVCECPGGEDSCVDAECGTSLPCEGGKVVGGFSGYGGTGPKSGIPLEFLIENTLGLRKTRPQEILAGENGVADTVAQGDDVQVVTQGTTGLSPGSVVVAAGRNLVLDTAPQGDDVDSTDPDGILAGPNGNVDSVAAGDDVQLVPVGTRGVPADTVIIGAGENGILDAALHGDDVADVVTGFEIASTCGADTPFAILAGNNGKAESTATPGTCVTAFAPGVRGQSCTSDAECGQDPDSEEIVYGTCGADEQVQPVGTGGLDADDVVVGPGAQGFLVSVPSGDDVFLGPGTPCTRNVDCNVLVGGTPTTSGKCDGPQKVVRVRNRRDGQFRRFWAMLVSDDVQLQTDFSLTRVRSGDQIGLAFIQDVDRDGLSSDVELLAGSSDFKRDTDEDGLDDFVEVRVGWEVGAVGSPLRRVFPDPRKPDSDGDGLSDKEELDIRPLRCSCGAEGPKSVVGFTGTACSSDDQCALGEECLDAVLCSPADFVNGDPCPPCSTDQTVNRTDPRVRDTDNDRMSDFDEVFGYLTGSGILEVRKSEVILAGDDLTADTVACPDNYCDDELGGHCMTDGDCLRRRCIRPRLPTGAYCDDVQVMPPGSGVQNPRTLVVAPGLAGEKLGWSLVSDVADGDDAFTSLVPSPFVFVGDSLFVGDDVPVVGVGERVDVLNENRCVDGSRFEDGLPQRFALCSVIKPGANGRIDSQAAGDDVLVPRGAGQKLEATDPLNPDTDMDEVDDGLEQLLGASPNDPGDTGLGGDADKDGLTDGLERSGWSVSTYDAGGVANPPRQVFSNPYVADTDGDGLPDYAERRLPCMVGAVWSVCRTDPTNRDTDGDGIGDLDELSEQQLVQLEALNGFFPGYFVDSSASARYGTDPLRADTDGDGISDSSELFVPVIVVLSDGSVRSVFSDPTRKDTDFDGADDKSEMTFKTDPTDADTDGDGRTDGREIGVSDPLVPDRLVTVVFDRIEMESLEPNAGVGGAGGSIVPTVGWWFLLRTPGEDPILLSDANDLEGVLDTYDLFNPYTGEPTSGADCNSYAAYPSNRWRKVWIWDQPSNVQWPGPAIVSSWGRASSQEFNCFADPRVPSCGDDVCDAGEGEYRCALGGDHSGEPCMSDADCGTSLPCAIGCPEDCSDTCPNNSCDPGENPCNCPADCPGSCSSCVFHAPTPGFCPCLGNCDCPTIATSNPTAQRTLTLGRSQSLVLKEGDHFTVEGLMAQLRAVSPDCGKAPNYAPSSFDSGCHNRYDRTFNFSDLTIGVLEDIFDAPTNQGDQVCDWRVQASLVVE